MCNQTWLRYDSCMVIENIAIFDGQTDKCWEWFLANVNSSSCSLYVIDGPSVCRLSVVSLSVTLVHPTQAIEIFANVSTP